MTTATLSLSRVQRNLQSKINSIDLPAVNWKVVCFIGFFMSLALLIFYVWQINELTRGYYLINSYEKQITNLSAENKNLEVSFAENSFLGHALAETQALNFQKVASASEKYIEILDSSAQLPQTNKKI